MSTQTSTKTHRISEEHERRFVPLLEFIPKYMDTIHPRAVIMQAYLNDKDITRIREEIQNGKRTYTTTKKVGVGVSRTEHEIKISKKDYEALLKESTCTLVKIREFLSWDGINFEFNTYYTHLEGYVQIEIEFSSHEEAVAFVPPTWFGKEVTDDSAHGNYSLAKYGKPK